MDAVLETPGFMEWLWSRGEPERWDNTFVDLWRDAVDWGLLGWTTPLPVGVAQIGMYANSASGGDASVSGSVFLDPYTGYSYGFWAR